MEKQQWYIVYTKPRNEKNVSAALLSADYIVYCPLNKVRRKWSDRYKIVEEPLFRSYVFVKTNSNQLNDVLKIGGVVRFLYWNKKPASVREEEIELIKRFLGDHEAVHLEATELNINQDVTFTASNLIGKKGKVLDVTTKTAKVLIESMGCYLVATVDRSNIAPLKWNGKRT